jgi:hypothetical protein
MRALLFDRVKRQWRAGCAIAAIARPILSFAAPISTVKPDH